MGERGGCLQAAAALDEGAGPVVIPVRACRKIDLVVLFPAPVDCRIVPFERLTAPCDLLLGVERVQHRADKHVVPEEIFAVVVPGVAVLLEIHEESPHEGVVIAGDLPGLAVDVREETVAELYCVDQGVIYRIPFLAEVVEFPVDVGAVTAHHRGEGAELHPPHVEFLELRVAGGRVEAAGAVGRREETAYVGVDIRIGGEGVVQAERHLCPEGVPGTASVAAPGVRPVALLAGEIGSGKYEHAFAVVDGPLAVIYTSDRHQRKGVAHAAVRAHRGELVHLRFGDVDLVRIGGVHPPRVYAHLVQAKEVLPVDVTGFLAVDVVAAHSARIIPPRRPLGQSALRPGLEVQKQAFLIQFLESLGLGTE